jgi:succinate dehydrogenase / fumarate reductase cytochrome b subunit
MAKEIKPYRTMISGSVGRKVLLALTGLFMVVFLAAHLAGNSTIWGGPDSINSYGEHLHSLQVLLWPLRAIMLLVLCTHVFLGITLTLENRRARHGKYAVIRRQKTTLSGRTMIWTGLFILLFLVYHILHFTLRLTPGTLVVPDGLGRMDVYSMIVSGFLNKTVGVVYLAAMTALFFHAGHGVGSIFQTLGIANDKTLPGFSVFGRLVSAVFLLGFGLIPILVAANFLN